MQGSWMIGDNYLTIRKWVPNFVPDEEPIRKLMAWIRIPNISMEYFTKNLYIWYGKKSAKWWALTKLCWMFREGILLDWVWWWIYRNPYYQNFDYIEEFGRSNMKDLSFYALICGKVGHRDENCPSHPIEVKEQDNVAHTKLHDPNYNHSSIQT